MCIRDRLVALQLAGCPATAHRGPAWLLRERAPDAPPGATRTGCKIGRHASTGHALRPLPGC
eukprot:10361365-Lingulodinium_polyedra.AAC.1